MWASLQHSGQVEFYQKFHAGRQSEEEDWMPMVRALRHLQSLPAAPNLFAFTSLWRFHITTAPTYAECDRHSSVTVIWRWSERCFHLAFGPLASGWVDDRPPEQICDENAFTSTVEPFIQRLLSSRPEH